MRFSDEIAALLDSHELESRIEFMQTASETGDHSGIAATIRERIVEPISKWTGQLSTGTEPALVDLELEARWLAHKLDDGPVSPSRWTRLEKCWRHLIESVGRDALEAMTYAQSERRHTGALARKRRDDAEVNATRDLQISATYLEHIDNDARKTPAAVLALAEQHGLSAKRIREILKQTGVFRPARKPRGR